MRRNMEEVLNAWQARRPNRSHRSISTDGETLWSYDTAILTRADDGRVILNVTRYSATTSSQQKALTFNLDTYKSVDKVRRGATRDDLQAAVQFAAEAR